MRTRVLSYLLGKNDFGEVFQIMIVYKPTINTLQLKEDKSIDNFIGWKPEGLYNS